jgi:hypothetical protein
MNSLRSASRVAASASIDALVIALGGALALGFAFMRIEEEGVPSSLGVFEPDREMLESRGVATADSSPVSSLSSPNESLLLARAFFFFFLGGASLFGVEDL